MSQSIRELLSRRAAEGFVGRDAELAELLGLLRKDTPLVIHVHGIPGIGKTSLLGALAERARAEDFTVLQLDCRTIEPTAASFLEDLAEAIGGSPHGCREVAARLGRLGEQVLLALDTYEVFRMIDTWLRREFVPSLEDNVHVLLVGREPPVPAWLVTPGWQELFQSVELGPLQAHDSAELLVSSGVVETDVDGLRRFAQGHPLALRLAASAVGNRSAASFEQESSQQVVAFLMQKYLEDVRDPLMRTALEAGSTVRRITCPMLAALMPEAAPQDVYDRLQELYFVEPSKQGLIIHSAIQQALSSALKAADPDRHEGYRREAWRFLRAEVQKAPTSEVWRHSADLMYLVETPVVREAFFPSVLQPYAIEPARAEEGPAILAIVESHEGPRATKLLTAWWRKMPECFYTVHAPDFSVAGFYMLFDPMEADPELVRADPVAARIRQHVIEDPMPKPQRAIAVRRWLDAETGDRPPSLVISAIFMDIKSYYVAKRPYLRRLYCNSSCYEAFQELFDHLGMHEIGSVHIDDRDYQPSVLDFGPALYTGWLTGLAARDLGVHEDSVLDVEACELVVEDRRVPLTPLELGVMQYLNDHQGKVVSRATLLEKVWGYSYTGGSNVVDAKIASLRKKLGVHGLMIETVSGMGYRFRSG